MFIFVFMKTTVRPKDTNQLAKLIVDIATSEKPVKAKPKKIIKNKG